MSWRAITEADVLGVLNSAEINAYQTAVIGTGQDPLADCTATVVNQCRGYIADNPNNALATGLTLPERVHLSALHLIRVEMLTRLDLEVSKDRESAKRDAIRFFERVSDGKVAIEAPDGTIDQGSTPATIETISNNERQATREKLAGL
jgi:hypothetical protein